MSFNPNPDQVNQVIGFLEFSSKANNSQDLKIAAEKLEEYFNATTEFYNYLAFVFGNPQCVESHRTFAGLYLKKKFATVPLVAKGGPPSSFSEQQVFHLKSCIVAALSDKSPEIRKTAANIVATVLTKTGFDFWTEIVTDCINLLQYGDDAKSGAFLCLQLVCEDCSSDMEESSANPLKQLIPTLIQFFSHPEVKWKIEALTVYETLLYSMPSAVIENMQHFLSGLSSLSTVDNKKLKRLICSCFVALLDRAKYLDPVFDNVIEFVLTCSEDEDEMVAQEASKFWMTLSEMNSLRQWLLQIKPYLPRLVPLLLKGTVYSEFEREMKAQDALAPSSETEINPTMLKGKTLHGDGLQKDNDREDDLYDDDDDYYDDEEELDDEDILNEMEGTWNLRKFSAQTLDCMSQAFSADILPHLLPHVETYLKDGNPWYIREAGVLALGAIERGCSQYLSPYLPSLIPYLMSIAANEMPTLRSVAIWTISKFSTWICSQNIDVVSSIVNLFLSCMLDGNKKVQEASASALCTIEECSEGAIAPFVGNIVDTIEKCFQMYRNKSLLILVDAVRELAEAAPKEIANPVYVQKLVPRMLILWQDMKQDDKKAIPLMSTLSSLFSSIGDLVIPYAESVVSQCILLIKHKYTLIQENSVDRGTAKDFIVSAIDLISGIVSALPAKSAKLLANEELFNMLHICLTDKNGNVKQTALGLVGDMAKGGIQTLAVGLPKFMPIICDNINNKQPGVASNATWAISEIAFALKGEVVQFLNIDTTIQALTTCLSIEKNAMFVIDNAVVALGVLAWVCPQPVMAHTDSFFKTFCYALGKHRYPEEKDRAYHGLCELIHHNNELAVKYFPCICDAAANAADVSDEVKGKLHNILTGVKMAAGSNWNGFFSQLDPRLQSVLTNTYRL